MACSIRVNSSAGNRAQHSRNGASATYAISATSNRLSGISGALNRSYTYKATGQVNTLTGPLIGGDVIFANGFQASPAASTTFSYDPFNRLSQISGPNVNANYKVAATGLRVEKTAQGQTTRFVYGLDGQLLTERNNHTNQTSQHLYLNGQPVALVRDGQVYSVMPDHLGRPELLVDPNNQVVWRAHLTAFERTPFIDAIGGYHLGFPGQYHDTETGFAYNVMRDYDPVTGRYLQSDPIGLAGGINTYAYANGNPLSFVDPMGLYAEICANGTDIAINIPYHFSGSAATPENIKSITGVMERSMSGQIGPYRSQVAVGQMQPTGLCLQITEMSRTFMRLHIPCWGGSMAMITCRGLY